MAGRNGSRIYGWPLSPYPNPSSSASAQRPHRRPSISKDNSHAIRARKCPLGNVLSAKSAVRIPHEQHEQVVLFGRKRHLASGYVRLSRRSINLRHAHAHRLANRAAAPEKSIGAREQFPNRERLDDAGARPNGHAILALLFLGGAEHHDRRNIERANVLEQLKAVDARQPETQNSKIEIRFYDGVHGIEAVLHRNAAMALALESGSHDIGHTLLALNNDDVRHGYLPPFPLVGAAAPTAGAVAAAPTREPAPPVALIIFWERPSPAVFRS